MIKALRPVLNDNDRAGRILTRFWQNRMALLWTTQDVHRAANEVETALTEAEARAVLHYLHDHHDSQYGLRWGEVTEYIKDHALGRPLTKREVHRFVHKDILTKA